MEKNNELDDFCIKNCSCYLGGIIKTEDFDFAYVLLYEKSYENILIYDIVYNTLIGGKPLRIVFDKVDRFIRKFDGNKYLELFGSEKYDAIFDGMRYVL